MIIPAPILISAAVPSIRLIISLTLRRVLIWLKPNNLRQPCLERGYDDAFASGLTLVAFGFRFGRTMHLCFIDESGTPPKPTVRSPRPYFVLAGVIINEAQWHEIAKELLALRKQQKFRVFGEIKWRHFGRENDDPNNSVAHLSPELRNEFRESFFKILAKRRGVKIIGCITNIAEAYRQKYVKDEEDLYFYTYKPLSERFLYHLQDMTREVGARQLGIIVADHRGKKQDEMLRSSHDRIVQDDSAFSSKYNHFVETLFLTPSHVCVGIQFADMVAGALGRGLNTGDWTHFKSIRPAIRTSPAGDIVGHGIAKFPSNWKWEPPGGAKAP